MRNVIVALAVGIVLGLSVTAGAQPTDPGPVEPLTYSRYDLAATTAVGGPQQVRFTHCPTDWDLPSFRFRFVGFDPRNGRLVLRCPAA